MSQMITSQLPVETMAKVQRQSLTDMQQLFERTLELQQTAVRKSLHHGFTAQRSVQRQGRELTRQLATGQLEALDRLTAGADRQSGTDKQSSRAQHHLQAQFDALERAHDEIWDGFEDGVAETIDRICTRQRAALTEPFESILDAQWAADRTGREMAYETGAGQQAGETVPVKPTEAIEEASEH